MERTQNTNKNNPRRRNKSPPQTLPKIINQHELNVKEEGTNFPRALPSFNLRTPNLRPVAISIFDFEQHINPGKNKQTNTKYDSCSWLDKTSPQPTEKSICGKGYI
jgi:hypothetical protein